MSQSLRLNYAIIKNLHDSQKEIVTFSLALPNCK